MRQPDDPALLADMLIAAREARDLVAGVDADEFLDNRLLQLAIEKLIENIGEAASRLSGDAQSQLPELPWRDIIGMRHRLVHGYMEVDLAKLWQVTTTDLDPLILAIEPLVPPD